MLAEAHAKGTADVAVVAIMPSEKQKNGEAIENFSTFKARLDLLGLGHLNLCLPLWYLDISFLDHCLFAGPELLTLERSIHKVLFPEMEFDYADFCKVKGLAPLPGVWDKPRENWRRAKCDVQALWSHINARTSVFVSSDANFHKQTKRPALLHLGAGRIEHPEGAARLLS
jgi:hypothetical protein